MRTNKQYAKDKNDERDYIYEDVFLLGAVNPIKKEIDLITDYQNQSLEEITKYMCVFYNTAHGTNILNNIEGSGGIVKGKNLGLEAIDLGMLDIKTGAYIVSGPKLLKKKGLIKGYVKVKGIEGIRHSISNNRPVSVGSNKINWQSGLKSPYILTKGPSYGHAFLIIGYNDDKQLFIIKNSYGKELFDNGKNYLKYSDIGLLFTSKYSLIDTINPILAYKKKIMDKINLQGAKDMFDKGYWNGQRATEPMSREEVMTVINRIINKITK